MYVCMYVPNVTSFLKMEKKEMAVLAQLRTFKNTQKFIVNCFLRCYPIMN